MKERDIFREGSKHTDPSYIFSEGQDPPEGLHPWFAPQSQSQPMCYHEDECQIADSNALLPRGFVLQQDGTPLTPETTGVATNYTVSQ